MSKKTEKLQGIIDMQDSHITVQNGEIEQLKRQVDDLITVLRRLSR